MYVSNMTQKFFVELDLLKNAEARLGVCTSDLAGAIKDLHDPV